MSIPEIFALRVLIRRRFPTRALVTAMACLAVLLLQSPAMAADHFDIVSVKPAEMPRPIRRHSPGRIVYEGIGVAELIRKAFALPQYQVVLPDWVTGILRDHPAKEKADYRFFTIEATMSPSTTDTEFQLMLQHLLIERFGLTFHRETRQLAQYELTFANGGPGMAGAKSVSDDPLSGLPVDNEDLARTKHQNRDSLNFGKDEMRVRGDYTVAGIAELFSGYLRHPMVDRSGSAEYYTIDLTWGWSPYSSPSFDAGMTNRATDSEAKELFSEMEKKLGLKVTLRSVPTEFLVVDRLRHDATEN